MSDSTPPTPPTPTPPASASSTQIPAPDFSLVTTEDLIREVFNRYDGGVMIFVRSFPQSQEVVQMTVLDKNIDNVDGFLRTALEMVEQRGKTRKFLDEGDL